MDQPKPKPRRVTELDIRLGHFKWTDEELAELNRRAVPVMAKIARRILRDWDKRSGTEEP